MKKLLLVIMCIGLISFVPNCNKYGIKKLWLFSKTNFAGIVPIDENGKKGKGFSHTHFIYAEMDNESTTTWDSVAILNNTYAIKLSKITDLQVTVGKIADDKDAIVIKPKSNRNLWLLAIQNMDIELPAGEYNLTLIGKQDDKKVTYETTKENLILIPELRP